MSLRSKKDRQLEVKKILIKLTELNLTIIYEPVRELLSLLNILDLEILLI